MMDAFKKEFKRYKQRKPPPDLSDVIDFETPEKWMEQVCAVLIECSHNEETISSLGLKSSVNWKVYSLKDFPGFLFITNPFKDGAQWNLAKKCLQVYSCKPNISNLDAHIEVKDSIWNMALNSVFDKSSPLYKLRWVTVGYHYDWNTKTYNQEAHTEFSSDLSTLFITIANALGFKSFTPEAGIINYYHLDSTLGGHTDHSEFDLSAPLFSLSLGQSAIFLLGGKTRDDVPVAMYMRSGDIMVMAGKSRLGYHAIPRILAPNEDQQIPTCLEPDCESTSGSNSEARKETRKTPFPISEKKETDCREQFCHEERKMHCKRAKYGDVVLADNGTDSFACSLTDNTETKLIRQYLSSSRININIRQVLATGQTFPICQ